MASAAARTCGTRAFGHRLVVTLHDLAAMGRLDGILPGTSGQPERAPAAAGARLGTVRPDGLAGLAGDDDRPPPRRHTRAAGDAGRDVARHDRERNPSAGATGPERANALASAPA